MFHNLWEIYRIMRKSEDIMEWTLKNEGMIPGVIKFGRSWAIPVNAQKPVDKRIKSGKYVKS